jgi:hypothetical protein
MAFLRAALSFHMLSSKDHPRDFDYGPYVDRQKLEMIVCLCLCLVLQGREREQRHDDYDSEIEDCNYRQQEEEDEFGACLAAQKP